MIGLNPYYEVTYEVSLQAQACLTQQVLETIKYKRTYLLSRWQVLMTNGSRTTSCRLLRRTATSLLCSTSAADEVFTADSVVIKLDAASVSFSAASFQFLPDPVIRTVVPQRGVYRCA